jgi:hypothetical protein
MAFGRGHKKAGPSFVGGEDGPDRLVCPGGERLEPNLVVLVTYIFQHRRSDGRGISQSLAGFHFA